LSSIDRVPEVAVALETLVPHDDTVRADWDDVVARVGGRRPLSAGRRKHRGRRLAIAVALLFLLLTGVATATYLLVRGNGSLAFQGRSGDLLIVGRHGVHTITHCPGDRSGCTLEEAAWSPDGDRIAFLRAQHFGHRTTRSVLYVEAARGGGLRRLAACGFCGDQWRARLAWSPDGRWIAFSRDAGTRGQESLWIVPAAGGSPRRLTDCRRGCADVRPTWSPNGRLLVFERISSAASAALYTVRADGSGLALLARNGADPAWSPDARRIAFDLAPDRIAVADADGSHLRVLLAGARGTGPGVPSWSPDGRKLVFFRTPGRPGHFVAEVWTMNGDGSAKKRLYRSGCCVGEWAPPVWSPDGRQIAFSVDSAGGTFVMNADGSGRRRVSRSISSGLSWQERPGR
jgi:Tol biopolymer transport system component